MRKTVGIAAVLMCVTQLGAQTTPPVSRPIVTQTGTRRIPQFENDRVRVWKSVIEPKQPLTLHRHEHGRTLVALDTGCSGDADTYCPQAFSWWVNCVDSA